MDRTDAGATRKHRSKAILAAVIVAVLIVIIIVIIGAISVRRYKNYLSGYWVGDPGFLEKAQLKDMQLFIGPEEDGTRQGYLIMTDLDDNFVSNQAIEVKEGAMGRRWWTALKSVFRTTRDVYSTNDLSIEYDAEAGDPPMPETLKMSLSMLDGSLTLYDDAKVWAFLEKDNVTSIAVLEAYNQ